MSHKTRVVKTDTDNITGLPFFEDDFGIRYLPSDYYMGMPKLDQREVRYTINRSGWSNITEFHSILDIDNETIVFSPDEDKVLYLTFVSAAHTPIRVRIAPSNIGVFVNDEIISCVPFLNEVHYRFHDPIRVEFPSSLEVKFRPYNVSTKLSLAVGGICKVMSL